MTNRRLKKKNLLILALFLFVVILSVKSINTIAYLTTKGEVVNTMEIAEVESTIQETFDGTTKSDVYVENTGTVDIYTRADILIYFEDENGNVLMNEPKEGEDYTISLGNDWIKSDEKYYYKSVIHPNETSTNLINSCVNLSDKKLVVEVLTQSIQANSNEAMLDAWDRSFE